MNTPSFDKGWFPMCVLDHWIKSKYKVEIYTAVGSKLVGIIKGYDNYNLTLIDDNSVKCIVFKNSIFYIGRLKE
jgi:sRNA-binding regulator protein Hfq